MRSTAAGHPIGTVLAGEYRTSSVGQMGQRMIQLGRTTGHPGGLDEARRVVSLAGSKGVRRVVIPEVAHPDSSGVYGRAVFQNKIWSFSHRPARRLPPSRARADVGKPAGQEAVATATRQLPEVSRLTCRGRGRAQTHDLAVTRGAVTPGIPCATPQTTHSRATAQRRKSGHQRAISPIP